MLGRRLAAGTALALTFSVAPFVPAQPPKPTPLAPNLARLDTTVSGLDGPGMALAYSERIGFLAAGCEAGTIQVWNQDVILGVRKGDHPTNVWQAHQGPVVCLAACRAPVLASAGSDRKVILWSPLHAKALHKLLPDANARCVALSPDGKVLAAGCDDGAVRLWDAETGQAKGMLKEGSDWLTCVEFGSDGKTLAAAGYDGHVRVWDVAAGKKVMEGPVPAAPPKPPPAGTVADPRPVITSLALAPDQKEIAVGGGDGVLHLVNAADGKVVRSMPGHTSSVLALAFHPAGGLLVSASKDRTLRLWNPANGQLLKALEGHTAWVQGVAFVARGTRLASVGADRTVRLWDLTQK
jgi:WD40 repeat protein